ncbi:TolB family protein [Kitasatospora sp. NPDC048194]|uniref:TolB family protein n=1 Tax=Kitasatospora sp. NPDC048194 TaxID=3364045 RepID=UPI00371CF94D
MTRTSTTAHPSGRPARRPERQSERQPAWQSERQPAWQSERQPARQSERRPAPSPARLLRAVCALGAAAALALTTTPSAQADPHRGPGTERVSSGIGGSQPDGASFAGGLSADGRYAVFTSSATNLVPGDTNGKSDVFVRDLWSGRTERVDTGPDGAQANGDSFEAAISGNGRYVAFSSGATNLVPGANLGFEDVYVHDRWTGRTTLVSVGQDPDRPGSQAPGRPHGRTPDTPQGRPAPGTPQTDRLSGHPSLSRDGRYIAFQSNRTDLAPGTVTWQGGNIYVHDLWTGGNGLVSIGADGKEANGSSASPVISADGGSVAFVSKATNITAPDQPGALSPEAAAELTAEAGQESDEQFFRDSFRADARPRILKPRLYPLYVRDLRAEETRVASTDDKGGARGADYPSLGPDGRYVVYSALVQHGDSGWDRHFEVYLRDLEEGTETLVSAGLPGTKTTGDSSDGRLTADGRWVYFDSTAEKLVPGDTNGASDVFRRDLRTGRTERVSLSDDGSQSPGASFGPYVDAHGTTAVFSSEDGTLTPGDTNTATDVFLRRSTRR